VLSKKTNRSAQTIPQKGNLFLQDKKATIKCQFCNKEYNFTEEELKELLKDAK
jgi:redox-regulated HSP33 family molecular chaperone